MTKKSDRSWIYWFAACIVIIFLLWLFYSDGPQEFVGIPIHNYDYNYAQVIYEEDTYEEAPTRIYQPEVSQNNVTVAPLTPRIPIQDLNADVITAKKSNDSIGETNARRVMERLFGRPFPTIRPNFLKNPETNANLELDGYNEELKIAFEYNGMQHYHWPSGLFPNEAAFKAQLRRDRYKLERCNQLGIYLINIPYTYREPHAILSYVWKKMHPDIRAKTLYN